jgi:8-oxo-dGTP diphosphatase
MEKKADITKYAALIFNEKGEVLFVRKLNKDKWINVGGRVEINETPIDCLKREINEELDCDIELNPTPTQFLKTPLTPALDDPGKTVQIIWYRIKLVGEPVASSEIEEIKWVDVKNPDVELSPQIQEYLLPVLINN